LRAAGPAGTTITLRHAEQLNDDGTVDPANLRRAVSVDRWTLAGRGRATWSPQFTYHGFRYVQIEGYPGPLRADDVVGLVLHTDVPAALEFDCDHPLLRRIQRNCVWTQRGNMHGMITDCPQRDERFGWLGDSSIFLPTACLQFDVETLLSKTCGDLFDAQNADGSLPDYVPFVDLGETVAPRRGSPGYMDGIVVYPWMRYWMYGDRRALAEAIEPMARYVDYIGRANGDGLWRHERGNNYGDWIAADEHPDKTAVSTLLWFRSAVLVARAAQVVGRAALMRRMAATARRIRDAFNRTYFQDGRYRLGEQAILALALADGCAPRRFRGAVADHLRQAVERRDYRLTTGLFGTAALLPALSRYGHHDAALRLALQDQAPSWGYMVRRGATTTWERWYADRIDPGMNSLNHPALASVGAWLVESLAGLQATAPAFRRARLSPGYVPGIDVNRMRIAYDSKSGRWALGWSVDRDRMTVELEVPPAARGTLELPSRLGLDEPRSAAILAGTAGLAVLDSTENTLRCAIEPGKHRLVLPLGHSSIPRAEQPAIVTTAPSVPAKHKHPKSTEI